MPSLRKRIGFLPRSEVQNIIDKICYHNKLSQSKVTGILVEEALRSRGVLNTSIKSLSFDFISDKSEGLLTANKSFNNNLDKDDYSNYLEDAYINEEVQMINDYIEFKLFKNIMNRNNRKINLLIEVSGFYLIY